MVSGLGGQGCSAHPAWRGWRICGPWSGGESVRCAGSCRCTGMEVQGEVMMGGPPLLSWTTGYQELAKLILPIPNFRRGLMLVPIKMGSLLVLTEDQFSKGMLSW